MQGLVMGTAVASWPVGLERHAKKPEELRALAACYESLAEQLQGMAESAQKRDKPKESRSDRRRVCRGRRAYECSTTRSAHAA